MESDQINRDEFERLYHKVETLDDKLDKIEKSLSKYAGFGGGVLFAMSCLTWALTLVWQWFTKQGN